MKSEVKMTTDELLEKATKRPVRVGITEGFLGDALVIRNARSPAARGDIVADAELTRRAVNSFEAMRKALACLLEEFDGGGAGSIWEDARAALKLANGENE